MKFANLKQQPPLAEEPEVAVGPHLPIIDPDRPCATCMWALPKGKRRELWCTHYKVQRFLPSYGFIDVPTDVAREVEACGLDGRFWEERWPRGLLWWLFVLLVALLVGFTLLPFWRL